MGKPHLPPSKRRLLGGKRRLLGGMQHLPRGYVRLKNSVLASAEGLFSMDADRFALERAARALVEESEWHVNAYKV